MKRYPLHQFIIGCVTGLLIFPPLPAQAQWIVFDPTAYSQRVKSELRRIREWVDEIQWYQELYTTSVQQLTTLQGVLKTVDKHLFKNQQAALLANDIGKILNDTQKLRRRLEGMTRYQIRFLKSIDDRLEQGIFDPDADMRDLQNYLLYTMGRDARQTVDKMMRTAKADAQLAAWIDERNKLRIEYATINAKLIENREKLPKDNAPLTLDEQINVQHLNEVILQLEKQAVDIKKRIDELTEKINQRTKEYGLRLEDMENFAYEVDTTNEMWKELQKTKGDLQKTLDGLILGASPPTTD